MSFFFDGNVMCAFCELDAGQSRWTGLTQRLVALMAWSKLSQCHRMAQQELYV